MIALENNSVVTLSKLFGTIDIKVIVHLLHTLHQILKSFISQNQAIKSQKSIMSTNFAQLDSKITNLSRLPYQLIRTPRSKSTIYWQRTCLSPTFYNHLMFHNNYTQQEYKSYHVILPANAEAHTGQLILGDLNAATDEELMREHKVKTIITAATGLQHLKIPPQLTHVVFPLLDLKTQNIQSYFELSYQTIEQNLKRGSVLVHCGAGISRSATLVIAYYMKKYKSAFSPAIKFVRNCRPNICPNLGFELQLKNYQQILQKSQQQSKPFKQQINSDHNKKKLLQTKQMLLTFNAPDKQIKSHRMANTSKNFSTYTPNVSRKVPNHSNNKKNKQETDFLVVGHNTQGRSESVWQEVSLNKGLSGIRRGKNNYSYKM